MRLLYENSTESSAQNLPSEKTTAWKTYLDLWQQKHELIIDALLDGKISKNKSDDEIQSDNQMPNWDDFTKIQCKYCTPLLDEYNALDNDVPLHQFLDHQINDSPTHNLSAHF